MVYQVLRRQSGAQPEIRRHDEQQFGKSPFKSTFREWLNGKELRYLGHYELPEDLHARGQYVILSWKIVEGVLVTYRKYPSGTYEKIVSGYGRDSVYPSGKTVPREALPADVREREDDRELMYTTRGTSRYREEAFAVPNRPAAYQYRRVWIDDQFVCVIEDLHIQRTDARGNVYILYDVIWPDGSRESWENHVFKEFTVLYIELDDLFPRATMNGGNMPAMAEMRGLLARWGAVGDMG